MIMLGEAFILILCSAIELAIQSSIENNVARTIELNRRIFHNNEVPEFELFIPQKNIVKEKRSRFSEEFIKYNFKAFGEKIELHLQKNNDFVSSNFKYSVRTARNIVEELPIRFEDNCLYKGSINSLNESFAAFSICDGLNGIIILKDSYYIIEPHEYNQKTTNLLHIIYKYLSRPKKRCHLKRSTNILNENQHQLSLRNSANAKKLFIETAVYIDKELYDYLEQKFIKNVEKNIQTYILTIIYGIQIILNYPSLTDIPIKIVLKKIEIWKTNEIGFLITDAAEAYLKNFCPWQSKFNPKDDKDSQHYDHAFLFTGYDIHSDGDYSTMGVAPMNGMCDAEASCTVIEGMYYSSVYVGSHECAHTLGIDHDGDGNSCDDKKYIMAPRDGRGQTIWSECSRKYFKEFLQKEKSVCLLDDDSQPFYEQEGDLPGQRQTVNQQCEMIFGEGSIHNSEQNLEQVCEELSCIADGDSYSMHAALEGTFCGHGKWCIMGQCVSWGSNKPNIIDGGWSEWSPFSECQSGCLEGGNGITYSVRTCTNPRPKNGGKNCEGNRGRYKTCSEESICKKKIPLPEFIKKVCLNKPKEMYATMTGKGKQDFDDYTGGCLVWCEKANLNRYGEWGVHFPDGTSCNNEDVSSSKESYCVQGKCQK